MYYTGTQEECLQYNAQVTAGENYSGQTVRWAIARKHPEQTLWAIVKHEDYESEMELVDSLSADWSPDIDIDNRGGA